jgi:polyisoprenyl-phosphate glycosyltransferase
MYQLKLSVIVPCYNEQEVIALTFNHLTSVLTNMPISGYEIIFINDGSTDTTLLHLSRFAAQDNHVKMINFSRNFGHQPAVSAGIAYCTGDVAVIMDADLQDPPEIIPAMLDMYNKEQCNVVYGVRKGRKGESWFKKTTATIYYRLLNWLSDVKLPQDAGDFRLIDRKVINEFKNLKEKHKYIRGLISWIGFKQCPIYYERNARAAGETKYPLAKMLKFATTGLLYFTKKPLAIAISVGLTSILIGLALAIYIVISKILHPANIVQGWTSLIVVIIFFGGVQLLSIGLLGKYLGSIFDEVKNRPEFIVESTMNF